MTSFLCFAVESPHILRPRFLLDNTYNSFSEVKKMENSRFSYHWEQNPYKAQFLLLYSCLSTQAPFKELLILQIVLPYPPPSWDNWPLPNKLAGGRHGLKRRSGEWARKCLTLPVPASFPFSFTLTSAFIQAQDPDICSPHLRGKGPGLHWMDISSLPTLWKQVWKLYFILFCGGYYYAHRNVSWHFAYRFTFILPIIFAIAYKIQ